MHPFFRDTVVLNFNRSGSNLKSEHGSGYKESALVDFSPQIFFCVIINLYLKGKLVGKCATERESKSVGIRIENAGGKRNPPVGQRSVGS